MNLAPTSTSPAESDPAAASPTRARPRRWRPATIHLVADLSPRAQIAYAAILASLVLLPLVSAIIVLRQGWRPSGDNALIGLRVRDVFTGHFPLVGQPSTGENYGSGVESSHPGAIEFYLIAPFVAILGPIVGLAIGAAAINSAALAGMGWLAMRRGGMELLVITTVVAALLSRSLGGNFLHDPISSNVGALAAVTLLFACWSIIAGDLRTLPLFVAVGTFALQDHLSYLGTGAPVVLVSIGVGIWWIRQIQRRASDSSWLRPKLIVSGVLGAVLWLPVLLDQLFGSHNISAIIETFTAGKTADPASKGPEGVGFAVKRLSEALAPWPIFSRRIAPLGWMHTPSPRELTTGLLILLAIVILGVIFVRQRRTDLSALAAVVVLAAAAGFYTAMKLPGGAGVKASNLRWMWTVSAFAWIALAWLLWNVLPLIVKEVLGVPSLIFGSVAVVLALASVVSSVGLATDRDGTIAKDTTTISERVRAELPEGRYRIQFEGSAVGLSIGPAIVHDLVVRGDQVYLDDSLVARAYGKQRIYRDQPVDGTILISSEPQVGGFPDDSQLIARKKVRVNRNDPDLTTVRVFLRKGVS